MAKTSFFSDGESHSIDTQDFQGLVRTLDQRNADAIANNALAVQRATEALEIMAEAEIIADATNVSTTANKTAAQASQAAALASEVAAQGHRTAAAASEAASATSSAASATKAAEALSSASTATTARDVTLAARDVTTGARDTAVTKAADASTSAATATSKANQLSAQLYSFNEVYLGKFAAAPTLDGNGNALKVGAMYENTTTNKLYVWQADLTWHAYDESAQTATTNAALSATNAAGSAATATASKDTAVTQAGIATTKAGEAATSATNAATSATNAAGSATTATTKAGEAATSATNAANSATTAANTLASKADLSGAVFTGAVTAKSGSGSVRAMTVQDAGPSQGSIGFGTTNALYKIMAGDDYAGMYFDIAASKNFVFEIGGSEKMRLSGAGNVLIGTATDDGVSKLQVNGSAIFGTITVFGANNQVIFSNPSGNGTARFVGGIAYRTASYTGGNFLAAYTETTFDDTVGVRFYSGSGMPERMRLTATGNILINTTTDDGANKLQVNGPVRVVGDISVPRVAGQSAIMEFAGNGNTIGTTSVLYGQDNSNAGYLWNRAAAPIYFATSAIERMRIATGGNVLIGTATDNGADKLQVNGTAVFKGVTYVEATAPTALYVSNTLLNGGSTTGKTGIYLGDAGSGCQVITREKTTANTADTVLYHENGYNNASISARFSETYISFFTQSAQRLAITTGGRVLIGTTTDNNTDLLQVNGSVKATAVVVGGGTASSNTEFFSHVDGYGTTPVKIAAFGIGGTNSVAFGGQMRWYTSSGNGSLYKEGFSLSLRAFDESGPGYESTDIVRFSPNGSTIQNTNQVEGQTNLMVTNSAQFLVGSGAYGNSAACVLRLNSASTRSINAGGSVNANGSDYAEYMLKNAACGVIAKGQVVGVDASGELTDKWVEAVSFMVKTTNPSFVGGDTWGTDIEGDELEAARAKVDRIAYAGQVPVNVWGASPGQFIVPVQVGDGISGLAVSEDDLTMKQYIKAVGIVQNILPDGRANVRVKAA